MPRRTLLSVRWWSERHSYCIWTGEVLSGEVPLGGTPLSGSVAWAEWLAATTSFAFQSRTGAYCTARQESSQRGGDYWYAYRAHRGRTLKRYIGRPSDLSIARLEAVADDLAHLSGDGSASSPVPDDGEGGTAMQECRAVDGATISLPTHQVLAPEEGQSSTIADSMASARIAQQMANVMTGEAAGDAMQAAYSAQRARPVQPMSRIAPTSPLLMSKLHVPRLPGALVARDHLLDLLDAGAARKLTLLSAPAGFGKTTVVRQWLADRVTAPVAWVSLDDGDDDPVRFWRYVITGCQSIRAEAGSTALAQLTAALPPPLAPPPLETLLTYVLNDLALSVSGSVLVLEDYHVITAARIHETLTFFVDHLPPSLHIVLLARNEPPLPLVRWRARDEIQELHVPDLRFSAIEASQFLQQVLPLPLPSHVVAQLDERLEGWPAGLRLLALSMQGPMTPREMERRLAMFSNNQTSVQPHRPILDYFISEVLHAQPEPLQLFLLQTSILSRLTGSLCDTVTDRRDCAALLEAMERAGLFLEPLDDEGQWYRYHTLFAEAMRAVARQRIGNAALDALSLQASRWYEEHSLLAEAIEAALHAREYRRVAGLIENLVEQNQFDELHTLRRWLEALPDAVRHEHPGLCLSYAMVLLFTHHPGPTSPTLLARIDDELLRADDGWTQQGNLPRRGEVYAFRAMMGWRVGIAGASRDARQALEWLGPAEDDPPGSSPPYGWRALLNWRAMCLAVVATAALSDGRCMDAHRLFQEAQRRCITANSRPFARITTLLLGTVCAAMGDLRQAEAYYRQVIPDARDQKDYEDIVFALLSLADLAYEWNDLETLDEVTTEASELNDLPTEPEAADYIALWQALLQHGRGRTIAALQQLAGIIARLYALASPRAFQLIPTILAWQIRLYLASGDLIGAERCLETLNHYEGEVTTVQRQIAEILTARLSIARGEAARTLSPLNALLHVAEDQHQIRLAIEIQMVLAVAHSACRQGQEARQNLRAALERACGEGYIRLFRDAGEPLAALLRSLLPSLTAPALRAYARAILQSFSATADPEVPALFSDTMVEPLSAQERRVLRLLAAGRSNPEIASELVVSVNTVKDHVKSLYRKLNVRNRLEATEAARRLR